MEAVPTQVVHLAGGQVPGSSLAQAYFVPRASRPIQHYPWAVKSGSNFKAILVILSTLKWRQLRLSVLEYGCLCEWVCMKVLGFCRADVGFMQMFVQSSYSDLAPEANLRGLFRCPGILFLFISLFTVSR